MGKTGTTADFYLDTTHMDAVLEQYSRLATQLRNLKNEMSTTVTDVLFSWVGDGRNEFECKVRLMIQHFSDMTDEFWDTYEELLDADSKYRQTDVDAAKKMDGVTQY